MTKFKFGPANYLKEGSWNVICDRCGRKYKREQVKTEWTGLLTCYHCWDPRHPYTLPLPIVLDGLGVPLARPRQTPANIIEVTVNTGVIDQYYIDTAGNRVTDILLGHGSFLLGGVWTTPSFTDEFFPQ